MSESPEGARRLDVEGPAAPPRSNGELVFAAPWESRVFGLTMALCDRGALAWEDFRAALIAEIGAWDAAHPEGGDYHYWEHWLAALEKVGARAGLVDGGALDARARTYAARPHGHDHGPPETPSTG